MKLLCALLWIFGVSAHAAGVNAGDHIVGNGGDVVQCLGKTETLDIYEARELRKMKFDYGSSQDVDSMVNVALGRLRAHFPLWAKRIADYYANWEKEALFLDGIDLIDVPDSAHIGVPTGCHIEQIVIQQEPRFPEDKRYVVSNDLWKMLDKESRAALILHELILRDFKQFNHRNSISTRYFNSLISADLLDRPDISLIRDVLMQLPVDYIDRDGFNISLKKESAFSFVLEFYPSGELQTATLTEDKGPAVTAKGHVLYPNTFGSTTIDFYPGGRTMNVVVDKGEVLAQGKTLAVRPGLVQLYENGDLRAAELFGPLKLIAVDGKKHCFTGNVAIEFDEAGHVTNPFDDSRCP